MSESFSFSKSFHEALKTLPREQYGNIMYAIGEYVFNGGEVELGEMGELERVCFLLIKPTLDASMKRKGEAKTRGRPSRQKDSETEPREEEGKENVEAEETTAGKSLSVSEPQSKMAKEIHEVFQNSKLPCSPFISFLQGEFPRGLRYIHSHYAEYRLTSGDIVKACENYASVVNDEGDYFKTKMPFDRFVEHQKFRDFLPSSFVKENWKRWGNGKESAEKKEEKTEWGYWLELCPNCGKREVRWNYKENLYICQSCKSTYELTEIDKVS